LNDESFEETLFQEYDYIDIVVCPPDVDSLTDDEGPDNVTELLKFRMFQGQLRCTIWSRGSVETEQADLLPTTSCQVSNNKSPKKLSLFEEKSDWLEAALYFTKEPTRRYGIQHEVATGAVRENC
jgi:hypothetical protein